MTLQERRHRDAERVVADWREWQARIYGVVVPDAKVPSTADLVEFLTLTIGQAIQRAENRGFQRGKRRR